MHLCPFLHFTNSLTDAEDVDQPEPVLPLQLADPLTDAEDVEELEPALRLQHSRRLTQAYTYDSRGRLQYTPANGMIGSFDFQLAFGTAISNATATGLVLTPAGDYQVLSC